MVEKILIYIGLFVGLICLVYTVSNYNSFVVYTFKGNNQDVSVFGTVNLSNKINILDIYSIKYNGIDKKVHDIKFSIYYYDKNGKRLMISKSLSGEVSLRDYLNTLQIYQEELYGYNEIFVDNMKYDFLKSTYIEIFYIDQNNLERVINISLEGNKYANNGLFYKGNESITV